MEFFRTINIQSSEAAIQKQVNIDSIPEICPDIIILDGNNNDFQIGSIWGEFSIRRDNINGGIRFSMLDCPNALSWTITTGYPPNKDQIILHLSINRKEKPAEFIEEINEFLDGWEKGLAQEFLQLQSLN